MGPLALAFALALAAGDPCTATDEAGRPFRVCFDPGNRLELSAGGAAERGVAGRAGEGGDLALAAALRWRGDVLGPGGNLEWQRDQAFLEASALLSGGEPQAAQALLWRGVFMRHRAEPFLLVPGPAPLRLPFPFDVGLEFEAGGARWDARDRWAVELEVVRAGLLLDPARHRNGIRRLAFGPEASYEVDLGRGRAPTQQIAPFSTAVLDGRAESADGLLAASVLARAGAVLRVPGGVRGRWEAKLLLERVVVAVNDEPVSLFVAIAGRGGSGTAEGAATLGFRLGVQR